MRTAERHRRETETPEMMEARLHQERIYQQQRLATEMPEERAARLEQLRVLQQQRIASESADETEERLRRDREGHRQQSHSLSTGQPLFQQQAVRSKMSKFHSRMAALQVPTCSTCMERSLAITGVTSAGSECVDVLGTNISQRLTHQLTT